MQVSSSIVDFHLFYDGLVVMQLRTLLTRSPCRVSDTQITVKAHVPLVFRAHQAIFERYILGETRFSDLW